MNTPKSFTWEGERLTVNVGTENNQLVFHFIKDGKRKSVNDFTEFFEASEINKEKFYALMETGHDEGFIDTTQFHFIITATNYYFQCKTNGTLDKFLAANEKLKSLRPDRETKDANKSVNNLLKELKIKKSE